VEAQIPTRDFESHKTNLGPNVKADSFISRILFELTAKKKYPFVAGHSLVHPLYLDPDQQPEQVWEMSEDRTVKYTALLANRHSPIPLVYGATVT